MKDTVEEHDAKTPFEEELSSDSSSETFSETTPARSDAPVDPSPSEMPETSPDAITSSSESSGDASEGSEGAADEADQEEHAEEQEIAASVSIEKGSDEIILINPMTFHAVDQAGWQIQEQTERLEFRNFTGGEGWKQVEERELITADQSLLLSGGSCSKQDDGSIVIEGTTDSPLVLDIVQREPEHEQHQGICVVYQGVLASETAEEPPFPLWSIIVGTALVTGLVTAALIHLVKKTRRKQCDRTPTRLSYGCLQNVGRRSAQQDSTAVTEIRGGLLAVVADGMGGLKSGDAVSQRIVQTISADSRRLSAEQLRGNLMPLLCRVNDEINRLLGPSGLYQSGSTMVAAVAELQQFSWISVGDSRIYLCRAGKLLQLNREHNFEADLLLRAVNHQISFQEAWNNPKKRSVSSFVGMGNLKYVDQMQRPVRTIKGDRFLLCSDGVFNTLSDQQIEAILMQYPDPKLAAEKLEAAVLQQENVHQDNFSAVILCYE